jgi:hypothetical protein
MTSFLMSVAKFSETMLWIVGALFVVDFTALRCPEMIATKWGVMSLSPARGGQKRGFF